MAYANSADPDQTAPKEQSDQGLHCLTVHYCAFDIFQKVVFCLALYTQEVNLQTFVMIQCKTICRNYLCTKSFILVIGF